MKKTQQQQIKTKQKTSKKQKNKKQTNKQTNRQKTIFRFTKNIDLQILEDIFCGFVSIII